MKKIIAVTAIVLLSSCAELQHVVNNLPQDVLGGTTSKGLSNEYIASGLKQALDKGIDLQVSKLTAKDGFFRNQLVKIALPTELQKVDSSLRKIGLGNLADEGLKLLNRAAEDAVGTATPIFVNAVKEMTFADAKNILLGNNNAATQYLNGKTNTALSKQFNPVIKSSLGKVGADTIWNKIITKYNGIPFTEKVNPDLTDYVTGKALTGVYKMIGIEEEKIRTQLNSRTSDVLKKVFALQDQLRK